MKLILNENTSPDYNLAFEEYVFKNIKDDDIVILWRNDKSVIIGNNQNAYGEINVDFVEKNGISVIRRLTGGGAVFHDLGNINFTFISDYKEGQFGDYKRFSYPVCEFLKTLGLDAEVSGRNDIIANGVKISGNAQTVSGGRILQHGTLLYSADISYLAAALKPKPEKIESRGIKSVKSRVGNIKDLCNCPLTAYEFMQKLYEFFRKTADEYVISQDDIKATQKLTNEKYGKWEWNFASSPKMQIEKRRKFAYGLIETGIEVEAGKILKIYISGDFFGIKPICELEQKLCGTLYKREDIINCLTKNNICEYISGSTPAELADMII